MKKIFTLLIAAGLSGFTFGQTVFQSDLSTWTPDVPTGFMGNATNIDSADVNEISVGATYGTSMASLVYASTSSHRRFTTQPVTVTPGETYKIEIWVAAQNSGELRTNYYDITNGNNYGTYNPYIDVAAASSGNLVMVTQNVTVPAGCTSAEFILSIRNTDPTTSSFGIGITIDSIAISVTTPVPPAIKKIYDIQYTTAPSGDSPEDGNVVTTKGVVTGIINFGSAKHSFFLQDSAKAWNGIYVFQNIDTTLMIGDSVQVTGTVDEYFNTTQIGFVSNVTVLNSGNTLPTPVTNSTMGLNTEQWEGVLVNITNAQCIDNTEGFGLWSLNDGSGVIKADDDIFPYANTAVIGTNYDVTGIGHYSFSEFKILPRDMNDISISSSIEELTAKAGYAYPNPVSNELNFKLTINNVNISIIDITGKTLKTVNPTTDRVSIDVSDLANGLYFYNIISKGEILLTDRFIIAK